MRLSEILGMLKINPDEFPDAEIGAVTCSTDKLRKGALFAAIRGVNADGHNFIGLAAQKGAAAVLGDEELTDIPENLIYIRTDNSEKAYALACSAFWGRPERELIMAGVTGTNGKTTVTNILRNIIISSGKACGLIGTVGNVAGEICREAESTTPAPEELYPLFRKMADSGDKYCVMEVSSHALARNRVYGMRFGAGVMTNVTQDHLDFHGTMRSYAEAKASLMLQSDVGVINADDPRAELFMSRAGKYVTYAADRAADFRAENIAYSPDGLSFDSPVGKIELPAGGKFSVYNALAAMAAASVLGFGEARVREGLCSFGGVRGRLELLNTKGKYKIYIDYAHTPDGLENVLNALRRFAAKRIITVFGCGGDRDRGKRPMMGETACRLSDFVVITSDNPRTESPEAIIADILTGVKGSRYEVVPDRREAIRFAVNMAAADDIILLAGKGHETYQIVGTERLHMDEREIVRDIENEIPINLT